MDKTRAYIDPMACDTCRAKVVKKQPIEHEECARRSTLILAPDMPSYSELMDLTEEERENLPARFHIPVFDDLSTKTWLCKVCWGESGVTVWPCEAAMKGGRMVFQSGGFSYAAKED